MSAAPSIMATPVIIAVATPRPIDRAGRDYHQRKRAAGNTHKEAMRCLKRRLADIVLQTMVKDTETSLLPTA